MSTKYLRKYKLKIIYKIKYTIQLTKLMIKKNNANNLIGTRVSLGVDADFGYFEGLF